MKIKKLFPLLLIFLLSGCFDLEIDLSDIAFELHFLPGVSLHPLYTEDDIVLEDKLLGTWVEDDETRLIFEENESEGNSYNLTVYFDKETKGEFIAHLVKIENLLFLDLFPQKQDPNTISLQQLFFVPTHLFIKVEQIEPELKCRFIDPGKVVDMIKKDPNILKHEIVKEDYFLITASTKDLQEFMKKHANDESLLEDTCNTAGLKKLMPKDPNAPAAIDSNTTDPNKKSKENK